MENFILLKLELEVEAEFTIDDVAKVEINCDIKPVLMAFPVTTYKLKQTDFSHNISVVRFPHYLDGNLEMGWHLEDLSRTGNMTDYLYHIS